MIPAVTNYIKQRLFRQPVIEKNSAEAYDLWSEDYDMQPGNLMLDLDAILFPRLLDEVVIQSKAVADIGCGTGRHWPKIFQKKPFSLTGFDVSKGMLEQLDLKFPNASTRHIQDNVFSDVADGTYDVILSTLTIAHIENLEEALQAWCRIAKKDADIIITDFHPKLLAFGGKRTFKHHNVQLSVKNFVHPVSSIKDILRKNGFGVIDEQEINIDESVKHYYTQQNALKVYEQFKGFPVIYGIHLKREK